MRTGVSLLNYCWSAELEKTQEGMLGCNMRQFPTISGARTRASVSVRVLAAALLVGVYNLLLKYKYFALLFIALLYIKKPFRLLSSTSCFLLFKAKKRISVVTS